MSDSVGDTAAIDRLEPLVAVIATAGRDHWRSRLSDLSAFAQVPAVQMFLRDFDPELPNDPNKTGDAIEAAINEAIQGLPHPYSEAAGHHFGYPRSSKTLEERFTRAVTSLGYTSFRWYDRSNKKSPYRGRKPRDFMVRLVAAALLGIPDPVAHLDAEARGRRAPSPRSDVSVEDRQRPASDRAISQSSPPSLARRVGSQVVARTLRTVAEFWFWYDGRDRPRRPIITVEGQRFWWLAKTRVSADDIVTVSVDFTARASFLAHGSCRVELRPERGSRRVRVIPYRSRGSSERRGQSTIIMSTERWPIAVTIEPGSTALAIRASRRGTSRNEIQEWEEHSLPDGITSAGVNLGEALRDLPNLASEKHFLCALEFRALVVPY